MALFHQVVIIRFAAVLVNPCWVNFYPGNLMGRYAQYKTTAQIYSFLEDV